MSRARTRHGSPAPVFAALGDATRLQLVSRLSDGRQRSITALTEGLELSRQAVTKHLRVLEDAGIVRCERIGRESRFAIESGAVLQARAYLARISEQWDEAIERLVAAVEE
ncbi:MAG: metalloregulator ArsR/SmtB family transcription factor [Myxococcales bacterium]|nr:metalloregulator ArsR/SmtB family transcription factor [Myxococcales bacterium]